MRRFAILVSLLIIPSVASARMARLRPPPPKPACATTRTTAMNTLATSADDYTTKSYAAVLKKKGLAPITLALTTREISPAEENENDKEDKNGVIGPTLFEGYGGGWEFVQDAKGNVWAVDRDPQPEWTKIYTICACPPITHGGARPREVQLSYSLPKDTRWKGHLKISYKARVVSFNYQPQQMCPQPP
jgi:hypothetical protein